MHRSLPQQGSKQQQTSAYYSSRRLKLGARFECKDPEFLDPGDSFTFTGLDIERDVRGYSLGAGRDGL